MESSQLRRISIIGISILCLSPIEFFSNQLFERRKEENVIISYTDMKLEPNYLSNNYEIFNPNIKATSEDIALLVSENKKKEITESEDNLESETTNEEENTEESTEKNKEESVQEIKESEEPKVVVEKVVETKTSTTNKEKEVSKKTEETTTASKKVEVSKEQPKAEEKVEQPKVEAPKPNTDVATSLVNFAKQFVGYPYKSGGTDLYNGVDCSGFTMKVYEQFGYSLPHSSRSQASYGTYVSTDSLAPGDLIFYGYNGSISHVAIYIGNGQIVHATTNTGGIKIASYTMMPIITARRILK